VVYELDKRGRRIASQPPSLVGKPLPDLKELGIDALPDTLPGGKILVCFWDMQQRPSRRCMTQLAKLAEQLKNKGITVIAVQASKTDREVLNQWIKKYDIPFPAGKVQSEVEKTRFEWGIKSLPWLILTNKEQVITAEGLNLLELNAQLESK
jgi:hypothetical protein